MSYSFEFVTSSMSIATISWDLGTSLDSWMATALKSLPSCVLVYLGLICLGPCCKYEGFLVFIKAVWVMMHLHYKRFLIYLDEGTFCLFHDHSLFTDILSLMLQSVFGAQLLERRLQKGLNNGFPLH